MEPSLYQDYVDLEQGHWWFVARRRIFHDLFRIFVPPAMGRAGILDIGPGAAVFSQELSRYGPVTLVEFDPANAAACRAASGLPVLVASATDLPLENETVGVVCALDVLEHIPDDRAAAAEIFRVLQPGGVLIAAVPAYDWLWSEHDDAAHHQRRYARAQFVQLLESAGFGLALETHANATLLAPISVARLLKRLRRRPGGTPPVSDFALPPRPVNAVLRWTFAVERVLFARGRRLPAGVSLVAVARKPG